MNPRQYKALFKSALAIAIGFTTAASAQVSEEELAAIGMPDETKTSIGTLRAENGVPTAETAELVYDYVDRMRAVQAFIDNQGAASMYACLRGYASLGATQANQPVIHERPMDADAIYLVANSQTVYVFLFLDLKTDGPTVLESPPETMGLMDDMWQNYVADLGVTGPDKGKGGKYLILPPGYDGEVPSGYHVVKSATYRVWYCGRGFLKDGDNKPAVKNFKANLRVYPLAKADNPPKTEFINASGKQYNTVSPNTIQYFEDINACVQYEPIGALDVERRGVLKAIGIEKGKPFNPGDRMKRILAEAAAIGNAYYRTRYWRPRDETNIIFKGTEKRWMTGFPDHNPTFITKGAMELDARMFFYCIGTGVTPYMAAMHAGEGSDYAMQYVDSEGNALDGSKNYKLTLPANIPVARFWSIIVYDSQTRSFVRTSQPGATLSSVFGGVEQNADGSTDIYFGPKAPKGKEKNWLETVPGDTWIICLRMYGPEKPWLDHVWQPGEIEPVSILAEPVSAQQEQTKSVDWREDYAYTLGVQAYIFSYPWVFLPHIRYAWVKGNEANSKYATYMAFNRFWKSRDILTPKWRDGGSPQNDVLYNMSILDLSKEPMVLTVPDLGDRYFTFELAAGTGDNFGYVGTRTTGNKPGHYVIVGPDWKGKLPDGLKSVAPAAGYKTLGDTGLPYVVSPNNTVYLLGRTSLKGKPDLDAVHKIQDAYALTPLSLWGRRGAKLPPASHETWKPFDRRTDPLADWKNVNREMAANPPREYYAAMLEQFKTIGIGPGLDVEKMDEATKRGLARAAKDGLDLVIRIGDAGGTGPMYNGFSYPPKTMGSAGYFDDLITRAAIQVQKGIVSNDSAEATYLITAQDSELNALDGTNKYTVHFAPGGLPDVKAFWSITMYDMTNNLVENEADRWAISSNLGNYQLAKDGSLTIYVQNESPGKDKEMNWLPSPKGKFQIVFRLYYPGEEIVAQTWEPPGFVKVK